MARAKKSSKRKDSKKRISNTKLMFLSFILLFIIFEALYILKSHTSPQEPEVAGISVER